MRALALIDGEHYAPVVRDALGEIEHDVVGALLVGGTEKLRGDDDYGVPLAKDFDDALARFEPEVAIDISDEPVLGPRGAVPARKPLSSRRGSPTRAPTSRCGRRTSRRSSFRRSRSSAPASAWGRRP